MQDSSLASLPNHMLQSSTLTSQNAQTIGALLLAVREERGVPIEQAARDTRIRTQRLREIESDDFSHFSHPSYARLFLVDYAKYLGLSLPEIRSLLPDPGECGTEGYQYLQEIPGEPTAARVARRIQPRWRLMPFVVGAAILFVSLVGGFTLWKMKRDYDRLGLDKAAQIDKAELLRDDAKVIEAAPVIRAEVVEVQTSAEGEMSATEGDAAKSQINSSQPEAAGDQAALIVGGSADRRVQ